MYKTYYIKNWSFENEDLSGIITKAENINDALIKFNHYLSRHYINFIKELRIKKYQIQELNKTEIIEFER